MAKSARATPTSTILTSLRAESASPPTWIKPQLAKLVETAPGGQDWLHEMKLDGYRMHARLDAGRVQILTRRGNDWTDNESIYRTLRRSSETLAVRLGLFGSQLSVTRYSGSAHVMPANTLLPNS
jgi:ATP-dependent DNA ligase